MYTAITGKTGLFDDEWSLWRALSALWTNPPKKSWQGAEPPPPILAMSGCIWSPTHPLPSNTPFQISSNTAFIIVYYASHSGSFLQYLCKSLPWYCILGHAVARNLTTWQRNLPKRTIVLQTPFFSGGWLAGFSSWLIHVALSIGLIREACKTNFR